MFETATALLSLAKAAGASTKQMFDLLSNGHATKASVLDKTRLLREVLVAREDRNDPFVGSWTLFEWQTPEKTRRAKGLYASSGNLSIFYRDPVDLSWHGLMTQVVLPDDNWTRTPGRSAPYSAAYKVALQMTDSGICGTVELLPGIQYLRRMDRDSPRPQGTATSYERRDIRRPTHRDWSSSIFSSAISNLNQNWSRVR
jgi:hypothetical protein